MPAIVGARSWAAAARVGAREGSSSRILGNLLREGVVGSQAFQHGGRSESADGVFRRVVEKIAPTEPPMHIAVEQIENFLRKIAGLFAFHRGHSASGQVCLRQL